MKVVIFGATGMVGAGALREALNSADVESVLSISRQTCGVEHPKLRGLLLPDLFDFAAVEERIRRISASKGGFALRAYQPAARRVYQARHPSVTSEHRRGRERRPGPGGAALARA